MLTGFFIDPYRFRPPAAAGWVTGVTMLPSTNEFCYDPVEYRGRRVGGPLETQNRHRQDDPQGRTDWSISLDLLAANLPAVGTVSLVVSWFGDSLDAASCNIFPATTFKGGSFERWDDAGAQWVSEDWRVSGWTQTTAGVREPPLDGVGNFVYGGTPSDSCIVRAITDLRARGLRVVFYPFLLMTATGLPWRGRIEVSGDKTAQATADVATFMGSAEPADFTRDATNLTVTYARALDDFTFRRMILHYANLCALAGGVDLFCLGTEMRGMEEARGPGWTKAGTSAGGRVSWDYPFVDALRQLAADVRSVFDGAGLTRDLINRKNLITYAADWSSYCGHQPSGENGHWPHLDQLWADSSIDLVGIDWYAPLSDWTTGSGGLDAAHWSDPRPSAAAWPPDGSTMNGLGLTGSPTLHRLDYLKQAVEGGEKFFWTYYNSENSGRGNDPNGSGQISLPQGDRLSQSRTRYYAGQQLLANKMVRWFWANGHQAIYDAGDGQGWAPHGDQTLWEPKSKSITFTEYGYPSVDKASNQPNVFYDPKSSESFTPFWSLWESDGEGGWLPRQDNAIQALCLQAFREHWGETNESEEGVDLIDLLFCCAWTWDARPYPEFPTFQQVWGDYTNWRYGHWLTGKVGSDYLSPDDVTPPEPF